MTSPQDQPTAMTGVEVEAQAPRKSVAFQPTITIVRFHEFGNAEERWHSLDDRKVFMQQARAESKRWISKGCYGFLLKDTYHESSDEVAQAKMDAYAQLPGEDYCRGLERHVCQVHGLKRDAFKKGAIRAIVNEGRKRQDAGMPTDKSWYQMGEISRKLSFLAVRFARRTGAADELVARQGEDASKVQRLRMENDPVQKEVARHNNPAMDCDGPMKISVRGDSHNTDDKAGQLQRNPSQRSVTSINDGWCHGPRETNVVA